MRSSFLMLPLAVALVAGCAKEPAAPTVDPVAQKPAAAVNTVSRSHDESSYAEPEKVVIKDLALDLKVDFDANTGKGLPWRFAPEQPNQRVTIGARNMAFFTATNRAAVPVTGTATFNVTPDQAGKYFTKIECFCFTEQTLQPGESMRMPVIYFVDPKIRDDPDARDIDTITLSYTFYPVDSGKSPS